MTIFKKRPGVRLRISGDIQPGRELRGLIILDAAREVPVKRVDVTLLGQERVVFGFGQTRSVKKARVLNLVARVSGPRVLSPGRSEFPFRCELPAELPPSFEGSRAKTVYTVDVRAVVPWWPDARARFKIEVKLPPRDGAAQPLSFSSSSSGPVGKKPYLEGSLGSQRIVPGQVVSGAVALNNTQHNRYKSITVALRESEIISRGWSQHDTELSRLELRVPMGQPADGQQLPFMFTVPENIQPSFKSKLWELSWALETKVVIRWASDLVLRIPVTVVPASDGALPTSLEMVKAPPPVGSERLRQVWQAAAAELGMTYHDSGALRLAIGMVQVDVTREGRGRQGSALAGKVRYPPLHLGLEMNPAGGLRRHLGGGLSLGDARWDRTHHTLGRNAAQIRSFGDKMLEALRSFESAQMDDGRILVEKRSSGRNLRDLILFAGYTVDLARALEQARGLIPPPQGPGLSWDVAAWRRLAARLQCPLETARMAIFGTYDGMQAAVETLWDDRGAAQITRVTLRPLSPLPHLSPLTLNRVGDAPLEPGELPELSAESITLLERLCLEAQRLVLTPEELEVGWPAPLEDPSPLTEHLALMTRLLQSLRRSEGPYR